MRAAPDPIPDPVGPIRRDGVPGQVVLPGIVPPERAMAAAVDRLVSVAQGGRFAAGAQPSADAVDGDAEWPTVRPEAVAILLVDLAGERVTYTNGTARARPGRAGGVRLADWATAAGLRDLDGRPLEHEGGAGSSPVCCGAGRRGEPVLVASADGSDAVLWATGLPLSGPVLDGSAMLVLLATGDALLADDGAEVRDPAVLARRLRHLRDRALLATATSFTISDPTSRDHPLVYVNPAFTRTTATGPRTAWGATAGSSRGPTPTRPASPRSGPLSPSSGRAW